MIEGVESISQRMRSLLDWTYGGGSDRPTFSGTLRIDIGTELEVEDFVRATERRRSGKGFVVQRVVAFSANGADESICVEGFDEVVGITKRVAWFVRWNESTLERWVFVVGEALGYPPART